jgi:hypothetical protein
MIVEDLLARIMEQEQDRASACFVVWKLAWRALLDMAVFDGLLLRSG